MVRCLSIFMLSVLFAGSSHATVRTIGHGNGLRLDTTGFPSDMKAASEIMQSKCTQCHTLERTFMAVSTGIAPISGRPFDHTATAAYGQKMLRKQNSRMSKEEVKVVIDLLDYLIDTNRPKKQ